jgi:predicted DNA-binding ribbon-helix-helix protein
MKKRSVTIHGHPTSITLEDAFWDALKAEAKRHKTSMNKLVANIDDARTEAEEVQNLSSAIRIYIIETLQSRLKTNEETL